MDVSVFIDGGCASLSERTVDSERRRRSDVQAGVKSAQCDTLGDSLHTDLQVRKADRYRLARAQSLFEGGSILRKHHHSPQQYRVS